MAESLKTILMSALTAKATPAETDTMIVGEGNVLKKITFSQLFTYLKDKLGINSLNTKLTDLIVIKSYQMSTGTTAATSAGTEANITLEGYTPIAITGFQTSTADHVLKVMIAGNYLYGVVARRSGSGSWSSTLTVKIAYVKTSS